MRIFVVCADPGIPLAGTKGASVHLRSLAGALDRRGHQVVLFTAAGSAAGLPVRVRPMRGARSLVEEAGTAAPDLIYERYALGHDEGLRAARALGIPFVLEVNAPLVLEASRHRPESLQPHHADVERRLFLQANLVVAVSEPLRAHVDALRGTDGPTVVLRNGFDPGRFPVPASLEEPVVAFLGHPKPWHGADRLPRLLAGLRTGGREARLLVIGGGKGAARVLAAAEEAGVSEAVEVTGPVPAVTAARRLMEASVAVAPYPPDPFFYFCPLKVIEGMAAGLPVAAPALGDIPDIVGDGGVLVPPGDDDELTAAIGRLLDDLPFRRRLGARARRRAFDGFTWDAVAERLVRAVSRLGTEAVA